MTFITTANVLDTIPGPLRDRMEVIQLPGYTEEEKLQIAKKYLVKRQLERNGLPPEKLEITDEAIQSVIHDYTREAGVRNLEREIGAIVRSAAVKIAEGNVGKVRVDKGDLQEILGPSRFEGEIAQRTSVPGVATGLAWTPVGGDILFIEASRTPGNGKLILTGQLGDVMKESAQAALTLVKSRAEGLGIDAASLEKSDIHVHVPAGAIPKDGPSAGVAMFMALTSLLTNRVVRNDTAMTGEISLRWLGPPGGRDQGEGPGGHACRHHHRDAAQAQSEGSAGRPGGSAPEAPVCSSGDCRRCGEDSAGREGGAEAGSAAGGLALFLPPEEGRVGNEGGVAQHHRRPGAFSGAFLLCARQGAQKKTRRECGGCELASSRITRHAIVDRCS